MTDPRPARAAAPTPTRGSWLRAFIPAPLTADWRERVRVVAGATLGILFTAWLCRLAGAAPSDTAGA